MVRLTVLLLLVACTLASVQGDADGTCVNEPASDRCLSEAASESKLLQGGLRSRNVEKRWPWFESSEPENYGYYGNYDDNTNDWDDWYDSDDSCWFAYYTDDECRDLVTPLSNETVGCPPCTGDPDEWSDSCGQACYQRMENLINEQRNLCSTDCGCVYDENWFECRRDTTTTTELDAVPDHNGNLHDGFHMDPIEYDFEADEDDVCSYHYYENDCETDNYYECEWDTTRKRCSAPPCVNYAYYDDCMGPENGVAGCFWNSANEECSNDIDLGNNLCENFDQNQCGKATEQAHFCVWEDNMCKGDTGYEASSRVTAGQMSDDANQNLDSFHEARRAGTQTAFDEMCEMCGSMNEPEDYCCECPEIDLECPEDDLESPEE